MHLLRINADWARQIATLRDATTEETHLIRFDNGFYRICRPGHGQFQVLLKPGDDKTGNAPGVRLTLQEKDLYVADIDGRRFERYASTLDQMQPTASGLDAAVRRLPQANGEELFRHAQFAVKQAKLAGQPCWGQASNAVHAALSPEARAIVVKRRTELTPQQRQFSERVDMGRIEAALQERARAVKVLKRPD